MAVTKSVEIAVGVFVALGLLAFLLLALKVSNLSSFGNDEGYTVSARFDNIGSLKARAPVAMAGVRIGRVASIDIDKQTYEAVVRMTLDPAYELPLDTSASVLTAGLLGEQYIGLEAGGDENYLKANDEIKITQPALILERLIGQFLFSIAEKGGEKESL